MPQNYPQTESHLPYFTPICSHGTKRVHANVVYQELISNRNHFHMNATRWNSLAGFCRHLTDEGIVEMEETPKGVFITWIDKDPETLKRQAAVAKKEKLEKSEEERDARLLSMQIEKAHSSSTAVETVIYIPIYMNL